MRELFEKILTDADSRTMGIAVGVGAAATLIEAASAWLPQFAQTGLLPVLEPSEAGMVAALVTLGWRIARRDTERGRKSEANKRHILRHEPVYLQRLQNVATFAEWNSVELAMDLRRSGAMTDDEFVERVMPLLRRYGLME